MIWIRQGRFDEAEALFRRSLAGAPEDVEVLNDLAWLLALRDQKNAPEALQLIDRAIEAAGTLPTLIDTRAVVLMRLGKTDEAVSQLEAIRKRMPGKSSFAFHLAWAYQMAGRVEDARTELAKSEKLGLRPDGLDPLEHQVLVHVQRWFSH